MAEEECLPTNQLPLAESLSANDTVLINLGGAGSGTTAQAPVSTLLGSSPPQMVVYNSPGTFDKGDYPGAKAVRVRLVAGGGGGGGAGATGANQASGGGGGGGGGYAEGIIPIELLVASEIVTVGSGGLGGSSTGNGQAGGSSSFGSLIVASGGMGGTGGAASSTAIASNGGDPGQGVVGDLLVTGCQGGPFTAQPTVGNFIVATNTGGASALGGTTYKPGQFKTDGADGKQYGGGGSGAANDSNGIVRSGGNGAPGVVLVEIFF